MSTLVDEERATGRVAGGIDPSRAALQIAVVSSGEPERTVQVAVWPPGHQQPRGADVRSRREPPRPRSSQERGAGAECQRL